MAELRLRYHRHLDAIESKITHLFALVVEGVAGATDALLSGNTDVVEVLAERELAIDAIYMDIEGLVNQLLALQAPVATDLRFLLCVLRVVPELERSHDLVVHIASQANPTRSDEMSPRTRGLVEQMGRLGSDMWREAADAWNERDAAVAVSLSERDDEMDALHADLLAELRSGRMALPVTMDMTLVARFYERLGDHAVNVARRVVYLAAPEMARAPQAAS